MLAAPGAATVLGALASLLTPTNYRNSYDQHYALLYGRALLDGRLPDVEAVGSSTPHPLTIATGAIADGLFGGGAFEALELVNHLAWAASVVACALVGAALAGGRRVSPRAWASR